jgi:hypothetical protein
MAHITGIGARLVVIGVLAGACSGAEESRAVAGEAGASDSAALAASAGSARPRVSNVMIGRRIGPGSRITEPTFEFAPRDTVHVSVGTEGTGDADSLTAAWRFQSGEILRKSSAPAPPAGENTAFHLAQPKGLKPGTYKVVVFLGGDSVDTKVFVVRR